MSFDFSILYLYPLTLGNKRLRTMFPDQIRSVPEHNPEEVKEQIRSNMVNELVDVITTYRCRYTDSLSDEDVQRELSLYEEDILEAVEYMYSGFVEDAEDEDGSLDGFERLINNTVDIEYIREILYDTIDCELLYQRFDITVDLTLPAYTTSPC